MKEICIYGHYGSGNHGNEAIIRGVREILGNELPINVYSMNIGCDYEYGLDKIVSLQRVNMILPKYSLTNLLGALQLRILHSNSVRYRVWFKKLLSSAPDKLFLFEMGDQYCENQDVTDMYAWINKSIHSNGGKTIALGGSVNEEKIKKQRIINDLARYDKLILRESLSYDLLRRAGLKNIVLLPDPAFVMKAKKCKLNVLFQKKKVIGIVIGGVAQGNEAKSKTLISEVTSFIKTILNDTKYQEYGIALIPHVNVGGVLDDVKYQNILADRIRSDRVISVSEMRADELKYVISQCHILITVRTHASIAAYSSNVPTIVLGYSIKSQGIATDILGTVENNVVDIREGDILSPLIKSFKICDEKHDSIQTMLMHEMKEYKKMCYQIKEEIEELMYEE